MAASRRRTMSSGVLGLLSMPMRASMRFVSSSVTGFSKAMSRAANHMRL